MENMNEREGGNKLLWTSLGLSVPVHPLFDFSPPHAWQEARPVRKSKG